MKAELGKQTIREHSEGANHFLIIVHLFFNNNNSNNINAIFFIPKNDLNTFMNFILFIYKFDSLGFW